MRQPAAISHNNRVLCHKQKPRGGSVGIFHLHAFIQQKQLFQTENVFAFTKQKEERYVLVEGCRPDRSKSFLNIV